ncbi:MAG: hypothetical protein J7642_03465 [Cyanobacteria bacterium SBC]|nr:hypothetical protein [Cyanobacteria bacterium SBC]
MNDFEDFTIGDENANEIIGAELADTIVAQTESRSIWLERVPPTQD